MNQPVSEHANAQPAPPPGPGARLRSAREARGLSIVEAANKLHLHQRMVEALESDDVSRMPTPIYARGYLRNYARLVGVDPEVIVAAYDQLGQKGPELKPPMKPPAQARSSDKPVKAITYLLTLGLVLLLFAWWQSRNIDDDSLMDLESWQSSLQTTEQTGAPLPAEQKDDTAQPDNVQTVIVETLDYPLQIVRHPDSPYYPLPPGIEPPASSAASGSDTGATLPDTAARDVPAESGTDEAETDRNSATGGNGTADTTVAAADINTPTLRLELKAESWIEIYDADGEPIYRGLGRAGDSHTFDGELPLQVVLGYAPGVEVTFRGERIDAVRHSRAGVARFTLGN